MRHLAFLVMLVHLNEHFLAISLQHWCHINLEPKEVSRVVAVFIKSTALKRSFDFCDGELLFGVLSDNLKCNKSVAVVCSDHILEQVTTVMPV